MDKICKSLMSNLMLFRSKFVVCLATRKSHWTWSMYVQVYVCVPRNQLGHWAYGCSEADPVVVV